MINQFFMALIRRVHWRVLGGALILFAPSAHANVIWPPAVYYYTLAVWWVIAGGFVVEFILHFLILRMPILPLAKMVILSNVSSTLIGLLLTWPLVFWENGVTQLASKAPLSTYAVLFVIFALNVIVEYVVAVRWLKMQKSGIALASFVVANAASYGLVVWVALSGVLSGT